MSIFFWSTVFCLYCGITFLYLWGLMHFCCFMHFSNKLGCQTYIQWHTLFLFMEACFSSLLRVQSKATFQHCPEKICEVTEIVLHSWDGCLCVSTLFLYWLPEGKLSEVSSFVLPPRRACRWTECKVRAIVIPKQWFPGVQFYEMRMRNFEAGNFPLHCSWNLLREKGVYKSSFWLCSLSPWREQNPGLSQPTGLSDPRTLPAQEESLSWAGGVWRIEQNNFIWLLSFLQSFFLPL